MTLQELHISDTNISDKGTTHDYIDGYYSIEFGDKRNNKIKLLEIGVHNGHSIRLWKRWFLNSEIIGIDNENIYHGDPIYDRLIIEDAYVDSSINQFPDGYFDYIIDDGPHTLDSQIIAATKWIHKVKSGGKLIIEDIQNINFVDTIQNCLDTSIVQETKLFDLRNNKNRYDDIIFEITKK